MNFCLYFGVGVMVYVIVYAIISIIMSILLHFFDPNPRPFLSIDELIHFFALGMGLVAMWACWRVIEGNL